MSKDITRRKSAPAKRKRPAGRKKVASASNPLASLTAKQVRFVAGKVDGKTDRQAALDAGYSESVSRNTADRILSSAKVRKAFSELLAGKIPPEKLVQRLVEGLDATRVEVGKFEGRIVDEREYVDYAQRLRYIELIARMQGLVPKTPEASEDDDDTGLEELMWPDKTTEEPQERGTNAK